MIAFIRTLMFTFAFYGGSLIIVPLVALAAPLGSEYIIRGANIWSRWHRWCARVFLGISIRFDGTIPKGSYLFALKHESMFEAVDTLALFDRPAVVFKRELLDIPIWGWVARRHGVIPIDRESGSAAVRQMLQAGKAAIADGRPIILFPEGTRVPHGETPPLRAGMAGMYRLLGLPIIPLALDSGRFVTKGVFAKKSGVVTVKVGDAIPPGLPREEVEARVHMAINALNVKSV
jgi:1-acyl-sn-glycerol-3-phosphate acyltransferase